MSSEKKVVELSAQDLVDLADVLGDAWAYRVGDGDPSDPNDPDISDADREGMAQVERLEAMFGIKATS